MSSSSPIFNIQLKKFDMKWIADDKIVVMIGKRGSGKSYLVKDLMYYHQDIPVGAVISPTESANSFFGKFIPPIFIHEEYSPEITNNFMKRQKKMADRISHGESAIDNRAFLIFDDCLYDNSWQKDKRIREVFMNGRHFKILFLFTMQHPLGVPPHLRTNIDFVFICREPIVSNRRRIYEHYAGIFPTFEAFCALMDQCTENFECLVINNTTRSNKIEDQVFWYKADMHDDFRIGPQSVWDYCNQHYSTDPEGEEDININTYNKSKGPRLHVKKID